MKNISERSGKTDYELSVSGGRRKYLMRLSLKGKPALQLIEKREDQSGQHRDSLLIFVHEFKLFRQALDRAVESMNKL